MSQTEKSQTKKSQSKIELTEKQQESLMREALREAEQGMAEGEAPIGCVLALGSGSELRVVARGHNRTNALGRKNAHAEIIAFENAGSQNGQPPALPLDAKDVILVSTLEPCVMCLGAAMESGVAQILFGLGSARRQRHAASQAAGKPGEQRPGNQRRYSARRKPGVVREVAPRKRRHGAGEVRGAASGADKVGT